MSLSKLISGFLVDLIDFDTVELYYKCIQENRKLASQRRAKKKFTLDRYSDMDCEQFFRFRKAELLKLVKCLDLEQEFRTTHRHKFTGLEGLCILLRRLSYPCRLYELSKMFHRSSFALSKIIDFMVNYMNKFHSLLTNINQPWLKKRNLLRFCKAIKNAGSPLPYIWGFIDGTIRPICKPNRNQRQYYSGHKRIHGIKFQGIICPNGIITSLLGPYIGRRHDSFILKISNLVSQLEQSTEMKLLNGENLYLYGDTGYANSKYLLSGFRNPTTNSPEDMFNKQLSGLRVAVEWGFGKVINLFAFLDFKKNNKLLQRPVGKYYIVGCLFSNFHTCFYGSETSEYFQLAPPTLEQYLNIAV